MTKHPNDTEQDRLRMGRGTCRACGKMGLRYLRAFGRTDRTKAVCRFCGEGTEVAGDMR